MINSKSDQSIIGDFKNFREQSHDLRRVLEHADKKAALITHLISKGISAQDLQGKDLISLSLLAIGEEEVSSQRENLELIEHFYESIGGIIGYHAHALDLMGNSKDEENEYKMPPCCDVRGGDKEAVMLGIKSLKSLCEIYPIGGLGDRLNLQDQNGEPLPTALLPFLGRSLLEILFRDACGREYLFWKLFSEKIIVPIALMTSYERNNEIHIKRFLEKNDNFGRPQDSLFIFSQISVPVLTEEGRWARNESGEFLFHPGGHGALWRMGEQAGLYRWLEEKGATLALIRQINNPLAGLDQGILLLLGTGRKENKKFGIASCERIKGVAEGVLALSETCEGFFLTNVEYTDVKKAGLEESLEFPTNTNILYADLELLKETISKKPIPKLLLNMKSDHRVETRVVKAGRLESMMQNISDFLFGTSVPSIPSFLTFNERKKTISPTKKGYDEGKSPLETPVGAFYDLLDLGNTLLNECGISTPLFSTMTSYLKEGPTLIFHYHPALGPLFSIISQKIRGGKIEKGSELILEIAELMIENINLQGSLVVEASDIEYGRCFLRNVRVRNRSFTPCEVNRYWKNDLERETLHIRIEGNGEFFAEDVVFEGGLEIIVKEGERVTAIQSEGGIQLKRERIAKPSWNWEYHLEGEEVTLEPRFDACHTLFSKGRQDPRLQRSPRAP